jgi:uncharacterized protein YxjI
MSLANHREFLSKEKWWSIKDKNWIMTPEQERIGYFEQKVLSIRTTYRLKNMSDITELIVQKQLFSLNPTFKFYMPDGEDSDEPAEQNYIGTIKKALFSIGDKYWYEDGAGNRLFELQGNIWGLNFRVLKNDLQVGEISKKFWQIKDLYGIRLASSLTNPEALIVLGMVIIVNYFHETSH